MMKARRTEALFARLSQEDGQVAAVGLLYGFVTVLTLAVGAFIVHQLPEGLTLISPLLSPEGAPGPPDELHDSLTTLKEIKL